MSHINEEIKFKESSIFIDDSTATIRLNEVMTEERISELGIAFHKHISTLLLQALEQGRTEGSRGDYGRKMYMRGKDETLKEVEAVLPKERDKHLPVSEINAVELDNDICTCNTCMIRKGFNDCRAKVVEALSKL